MKKRLLFMFAALTSTVLLCTILLYLNYNNFQFKNATEDFLSSLSNTQKISSASQTNTPMPDAIALALVSLNEIEQLAKSDLNAMSEKIAALRESLRLLPHQTAFASPFPLLILCFVCIICLAIAFAFLYFSILHPFDKLEHFAAEISAGNFDLPLNYERSNYFGAFTWAFDSMRREITRARAGERESINNNKTVIATLSHDIKTPIASIRAYAEGLEAGLYDSPEKRAKYLDVIMKKCDEVSRLTNDLFLHSLTDLDKLKISPKKIDLNALLKENLAEISGERDDLYFISSPCPVFVLADENRLIQVMENLINNARKYAKTEIDISLHSFEEGAELMVKDYGKGIPDEDMPFIFQKFYRGKNSEKEEGAGLGLYIVKYIIEQLGGTISVCNWGKGLEVKILLPAIVNYPPSKVNGVADTIF